MFMKQFLESAAEQCKILESHFSKRRSEIETLLAGNIIADEAAKAAPQYIDPASYVTAVLSDTGDKQPVAAGDVPEWFHYEWFTSDDAVVKVKAAIETTISRRVAEAVAAKDNRIAELEAIVADRSDMVKCVSDANSGLARHRDSLRQQLAASQTEVERLKDQLDCKQAFWDAEIEISKTVTKERDEYFAEIVKLCSEVSRLKDMSNFEERANAWSMIWKTCNEVGMDSFKCDEHSGQGIAVAFIRHLASEVSRLTRPVEGDWWAVVSGRSVFAICKWQDRAEEYQASHCPSGAVERINFNPDTVCSLRKDLQSERNARETAERERDELREAHRLYSTCRWTKDYPKPRVVKYGAVDRDGTGPKDYTFDDPNDAVLAAFRAEKGKVQS